MRIPLARIALVPLALVSFGCDDFPGATAGGPRTGTSGLSCSISTSRIYSGGPVRVFPNAGHGYGRDGLYMMRRRWDYFVQHLLGAEPPKGYQIGRQPLVP